MEMDDSVEIVAVDQTHQRAMENGSAHINITIRSQDGRTVSYKVKRNVELGKLMKLYCDRHSLDLKTIVFLFDGARVKQSHTPDQLQMEDDEELDAMLHQTSGGYSGNVEASASVINEVVYHA